MGGRVKHIDIAKGISIFFVSLFHSQPIFYGALAHSKLGSYFQAVIEPMSLFRLPLFFFLSGVFFTWTVSPKIFLAKISEALLKPYFSVLLLVFAISIVLGGDGLWWQLAGIFYGNGDTITWFWIPLWFLPHLFVVYLFSYILFRCFKFYQLPPGPTALVLLIFTVIGVFCIQLFWQLDIQVLGRSIQLPGLPFSLDIILITSVCFISGHILKTRLIQFSPNLQILIPLAVLLVLIAVFTDAHIDLNKRIYKDPFFATLGAVCGIYVVISIAWFISKGKWLSYVLLRMGEASLYILIFHFFIQRISYSILSAFVTDKAALFVIGVISLGLSVSIPLLIKWVVVRSDILSLAFLPFESNKSLQRILNSLR